MKNGKCIVGEILLRVLERLIGKRFYMNTKTTAELIAINPGRKDKRWIKEYYARKLNASGLIIIAGLLGLIAMISVNAMQSSRISAINRNSYGDKPREVELYTLINGEREKIQINVSPREYEKDDAQKLLAEALANLDKVILGENKSLNHVESNLNLVSVLNGGVIIVDWEPDSYKYINSNGELKVDNIPEAGGSFTLRAKLNLGDYSELYEKEITVFRPAEGVSNPVSNLLADIEKLDESSSTEASLLLPTEVDGAKVFYEKPMDYSKLWIFVLVILGAILVYVKDDESVHKIAKKREVQLIRGYPEILNKLVLLLGAGMTTRRAWERIEQDFSKSTKNSFLLVEIRSMLNELKSGISEVDAYEHFGQRCGLPSYMRFSVLLSQNLKKGNRDLIRLLRQEMDDAFARRKNSAKKLGEEAGSKLLIPMITMLGVVMMLVMMPAFMTIGI